MDFQQADSGFPLFSGILDSKSWILDSRAQYSGFHKQKFPGFRNPDYLTWGDDYNSLVKFWRMSFKEPRLPHRFAHSYPNLGIFSGF